MSDPVHSDQATPSTSGSGLVRSPPPIPTSDVGNSAATSPAISEPSTIPLTECDRSAAVALVQMGENPVRTPTAIPPPRPSPIPASSGIAVGHNISTSDSSEFILLPSTRIEIPCAVDRATLDAAIDSLYLRLDLQQTVVDQYRSMEIALDQQTILNRRLNQDLQDLRTSASSFVQFAQSKYDRMRVRYEEEAKKSEAFREALADRTDQSALIKHLKSEIIRTVRVRHAAQEKADCEIAGIRKQMDEAGDRLVAECDKLSRSLDKAKHKKSKYKRAGLQLQGKLHRALKQVAGLQADQEELCRALKQVSGCQAKLDAARNSVSARSAECDRLNKIISARDAALDQMGTRIANVIVERDRILREHTALRDRVMSLVAVDFPSAATKMGSSVHTSVPATLPPTSDISGSNGKRLRDPPSSLPLPKRMARSASAHVTPSPVLDPKVPRSDTAKVQSTPVLDPKAPRSATAKVQPSVNPARPTAPRKLVKQKRRDPSSTSSEKEDTSEGEDATLAALSRSRSSSRRRSARSTSQPLSGSSPDPIIVDSPSPPHNRSSPAGRARPAVTKVSRADLFWRTVQRLGW